MANAISATVSMTSTDCSRRCPMKKSMNQRPVVWPAVKPARRKRPAGSQVSDTCGARHLQAMAPPRVGAGTLRHDDVAQVEHVVGALHDLQLVFNAPRHGLLV